MSTDPIALFRLPSKIIKMNPIYYIKFINFWVPLLKLVKTLPNNAKTIFAILISTFKINAVFKCIRTKVDMLTHFLIYSILISDNDH